MRPPRTEQKSGRVRGQRNHQGPSFDAKYYGKQNIENGIGLRLDISTVHVHDVDIFRDIGAIKYVGTVT